MPFEVYKARVKIVRDEEVVKKWVEDQSWKTEYVCLNMPEPLKLADHGGGRETFPRDPQGKHHQAGRNAHDDRHGCAHPAQPGTGAPGAHRLGRSKAFPAADRDGAQPAIRGTGLQFFKVNKTITHVSVARPHYLDLEATPVSEGVKADRRFHQRPSEMHAAAAVGCTGACAAAARLSSRSSLRSAEPAPSSQTAEPVARRQPTPEQTAVIADLHWLIHQGHVIEFANGILETAKKPVPKPPKPGAESGSGTPRNCAPEQNCGGNHAEAMHAPSPGTSHGVVESSQLPARSREQNAAELNMEPAANNDGADLHERTDRPPLGPG